MRKDRNSKSEYALEGIKILDLTTQAPGPYCSMLLADLGAEVIKVEHPEGGDYARLVPLLFNNINRNKKSITLQLKSRKGKEIFDKLVRRSDVVLEGFRPGVAKRLSVDYETIKVINPEIIYCSISGFGQEGPYKEIPGHDINYLGISGFFGLSKEFVDHSEILSIPVADISGSMFAVVSVLSALMFREKTGKGQLIDVSMTDSMFSWMSNSIFANPGDWGQKSNDNFYIPHYGIFRTRDDKHITLGIVHEDHFWENLCSIIDLGELKKLELVERIVRRDEIYKLLKSAFITKTRDEWIEAFTDVDVPFGPVLDIDESLDDPQMIHRNMVYEMEHPLEGVIKQRGYPVKFSRSSIRRGIAPPALGQHNIEILSNLGYSGGEIEQLRKKRVIS